MAYNKQVNPYGVSSSELGWKGFADGGKHGNPGAVQVKDNPYAKYTAQIVGDIAWNAGKELTAPEYQGVDELSGKDIYKQGIGRYIFGNQPLQEGSVFQRDLPKLHDSFNKKNDAYMLADIARRTEEENAAVAANNKRIDSDRVIAATQGGPLANNKQHPVTQAVHANPNKSGFAKSVANNETLVGVNQQRRLWDLQGNNPSNFFDTALGQPWEYFTGDQADRDSRAEENKMESWYEDNDEALLSGKYGLLPAYEDRMAWYKQNILTKGRR